MKMERVPASPVLQGMDRDLKLHLGKQLRKEFCVPEDLPPRMRKALEALARAGRDDIEELPAANEDDAGLTGSITPPAREGET